MIAAQQLTKRYGDKLALDDVSFSIQKGEIVGLLGLNGAGKSTTMNILTGYISPSGGTASIDGHDIIGEPRAAKRQVGYLPESLAFYTDMRVREYLHFICDLKGVAKDRAAHVDEVCGKVGISAMKGRMIRNLSKGYRQRVGLAQALVGSPKVLILDEPTVGLDPSQLIEIRGLIKEVGRDNTIIISSHILSEIQAICTRVLVLYAGRLVADAPTERLGDALQTPHQVIARVQGEAGAITTALNKLDGSVRIKKLGSFEEGAWDFELTAEKGRDIRAAVFRTLAKADLPLLSTHGASLTLEDTFLALIDEQVASKSKKGGGKK